MLASIDTSAAGAHALLLNASRNAQEIFIQAMMINSMRDGLATFSAEAGSELSAYAEARSTLQTRNTNLFTAQLAHKWIPYLKVVLELIFYASFPMLLPFMLLPKTGPSIIQGYFSGFVFLQVWGPLFVILNKIMVSGSVTQTRAAAFNIDSGASSSSLTLFNMDAIAQASLDIGSIAGWLTMLIPVIAAALTTGVNRVAQQSESLLASVRAGATDVAREVSTGNMSIGTSEFDRHSYNMMTGNKYDTNTMNDQGQFAMRLQDGSVSTWNGGGRQIINSTDAADRMFSSLTISQSAGGRLSASAQTEARLGQSKSIQASSAYESSILSLLQMSDTSFASLESGSTFAYANDSQVNQNFANVRALREMYQAGVDTSSRYSTSGQLTAESRVGVEMTAGLKVPGLLEALLPGRASAMTKASGSLGASTSGVWQDATAATSGQNTSSSLGDEMSRSVAEVLRYTEGLDLANRTGQSETELRGLNENYQQSKRLTSEAQSHMQRSQASSQLAEQFRNGSVNTTTPLDTAFLQWYGEQEPVPGYRNDARYDYAADLSKMFSSDRAGFQSLVDRFVDDNWVQPVQEQYPVSDMNSVSVDGSAALAAAGYDGKGVDSAWRTDKIVESGSNRVNPEIVTDIGNPGRNLAALMGDGAAVVATVNEGLAASNGGASPIPMADGAILKGARDSVNEEVFGSPGGAISSWVGSVLNSGEASSNTAQTHKDALMGFGPANTGVSFGNDLLVVERPPRGDAALASGSAPPGGN